MAVSDERAAARAVPPKLADLPPALGRYRVLLVLLIGYLVIGALTRVLLWAVFSRGEHVSVLRLLLAVLPIGALNDAVASAYLLVPVSLVLLSSPRSLYTRNAGLRTVGIVSCMVLFGMLYLAAMEYFFLDEFNARFNLVAVDYQIGR